MTFEEAESLCKPGEYFKQLSSGWNEYFTQYGKDTKGSTFWTAGNTCGGPMTEQRRNPKYLKGDNYGIYTNFNDNHAKVVNV